MSAHAAWSAKAATTSGTGKAAPVCGGLMSKRVSETSGAVVFLQNNRSEIWKHKQKRESYIKTPIIGNWDHLTFRRIQGMMKETRWRNFEMPLLRKQSKITSIWSSVKSNRKNTDVISSRLHLVKLNLLD